jgi:hypothetical protein
LASGGPRAFTVKLVFCGTELALNSVASLIQMPEIYAALPNAALGIKDSRLRRALDNFAYRPMSSPTSVGPLPVDAPST